MASYSTHGLEELSKAFDTESTIPDDIKNAMLQSMGEILAEATKMEGQSQGVRDPNSSTHILDTIKLTKPKLKQNYGEIAITFKGTRTDEKHKKKIRNAEIAFLNEFGKENQTARPFMQDAIIKNADKINEAGAEVLFHYLDKN